MTKQRLGTDPLGWIKSTTDTTQKSKQTKKTKAEPVKSKKDDEAVVKKTRRVITKSSQEGLREGWTRATFIVREDLLEKIKDLAYWERKQLREILNEVLENYLKGKKVKPREGRKDDA